MNGNLDDALDAQLTSLNHDDSFHFIELLKESEWERTETVRDSKGELRIRKYLIDEEGFGDQYASLVSLNNPALAQVYETYDVPGYHVVIMEYCAGPTLREWVESEGVASNRQASAIACDLCTGVSALHNLNPPVIHRDIKPDNVIMTASGVKLIDFGIARQYTDQKSADTKTWGTLGYAAPEQMGFGQSDNRTDVYAIGMLMYFLLTGENPQSDIRHTLQNNTSIDKNLRSIITRCIDMNPDKRFASAGRLQNELLSSLRGQKLPKVHRPKSEALGHLWTAWQALGVATMVLFVIVSVFMIVDVFSFASVEDATLYAVMVICINLFMIEPICCYATNLGGWMTRWKFLETFRIGKLFGIAALCFVLLFATVGTAAGLQSPSFEQQKTTHQQK